MASELKVFGKQEVYNDLAFFLLTEKDSHIFKDIPEKEKYDISWISSVFPLVINKTLPKKILADTVSSIEHKYAEVISINKKLIDFEKQWDDKLIKRETKINALESKLKGYEQEYNFIALNKGFQNLGKLKAVDLKEATISVSIWMFVSLLIPILSTIFFYKSDPLVFIPTSSVLIMTLFFYRVALINKNSIKSQILQIDLRQTLCQFIESYSDFSADLKNKNEHTLKKFEDLIFSGLVASDDKLPTTFDGVNQLSSLFKDIKK